jgi:hypothetical protein
VLNLRDLTRQREKKKFRNQTYWKSSGGGPRVAVEAKDANSGHGVGGDQVVNISLPAHFDILCVLVEFKWILLNIF